MRLVYVLNMSSSLNKDIIIIIIIIAMSCGEYFRLTNYVTNMLFFKMYMILWTIPTHCLNST